MKEIKNFDEEFYRVEMDGVCVGGEIKEYIHSLLDSLKVEEIVSGTIETIGYNICAKEQNKRINTLKETI